MYLTNPNSIPGLAIVPLVVMHAGAVALGYYLGARLTIAKRTPLLHYLMAGGASLSLLGLIVLWQRLGVYGTYSEFHHGRALSIMDVKLGYVLICISVGIVAASGFVAFELTRDSRRVGLR